MHELGIAQNIVDIVNQYVPEGQERLVRSVRLKVGRLSGVVPESLEFCFSTIIGETPLDSAKLDIEHTPVKSRCCDCGEEFTVELERKRLKGSGRDDLAKKVEWVSDTTGDGLGFDVLSFDEADDSERLIEVKTTTMGKYFPFYVTSNAVRCSESMAKQYHLYRLFRFTPRPRLYVLHGALSDLCRLEPVSYRATVAGKEATHDA